MPMYLVVITEAVIGQHGWLAYPERATVIVSAGDPALAVENILPHLPSIDEKVLRLLALEKDKKSHLEHRGYGFTVHETQDFGNGLWRVDPNKTIFL